MKMRRLIGLLMIGAVLKFGNCFPNLKAINIPEVEILAHGDVNNFENEQHKRSIKSGSLSMNDVEATIKEVEELIKANPNLPRLTRGEILDILENITKTDIERTKVMTRQRDPKAIMVVMPYTPPNPNDDRNIEEFFTKPPITQIIGSDPVVAKQNSIQNKNKSGRKPFVKNREEENLDENEFYQAKRIESKKVPAQITTIKPKFQEIKTTTTLKPFTFQTSTSSIIKETSTKLHARYSTIVNSFEKTTENPISSSTRRHHHRRRPISTTVKIDTPATTHRPHRTRRPTRRRTTPTSSTVTTTTTLTTTSFPETKHPNHKYPDESEEIFESYNRHYLPNSGLTIIKPPNLVLPADINSGFYDLAMEENNHGQPYFGKSSTLNFEGISTSTEKISKPSSEVSKKEALAEEINLPEHLHGVVTDMKLDPSLIDVPEDFHKKYEVTTHSPSEEERKKIQAILESIGAVPVTQPPPTTTTLIPDVSNVADTLSPDMRDLLMSFGLIPNPREELEKATEKTVPFVSEKAEVDPASFVGFKPLPDDGESRDEMESLLASFGLGRSYRREKSLRRNKDEDRNNELNFDVVPEQYKHVIEDIGFRGKGRRIDVSPSKNAVFNAHYKRENSRKNEDADSQDIKKLEQLMSTIKYLDSLNRTLTDQDIKTVDASALRELVESLNTENKVVPLDEQSAPNPVNFDNGIKKNEVKRQEIKLEGNITVVTPSVSSTSEESKTPSLEDLEGSFGGQTSTSTTEEPTTTTTKRTGFYYLVDWNTFLDIDDQKGKRVNLRFQPTIGNPRNFLGVNVP